MTRVNVKEVRGIIGHFKELPDPRSSINRRHLLVDVIVISICGVIAGADGPSAIEQWAKAQQTWLKKYLRLPNGIPSHDTISRVFRRIKPEAFQECFLSWVQTLHEELGWKHVAIDEWLQIAVAPFVRRELLQHDRVLQRVRAERDHGDLGAPLARIVMRLSRVLSISSNSTPVSRLSKPSGTH